MRRIGFVALIAITGTAACAPRHYETPAPTQFNPAQVHDTSAVPFGRIRAYAATLRFDTVRGAADSVLYDFAAGRVSPGGEWALIQPETGAWALDSTELAEGRIIARIKAQSVHAAQGYGPTWWTWWWVDKQGGHWRSVLLSDSLKPRVQETLYRTTHVGYEWRQSITRWTTKWGTCDKNSCCWGP